MTEEQKARIRLAAMELADALTDVGDRFDVVPMAFDVTTIEDGQSRRYIYAVEVSATHTERIL